MAKRRTNMAAKPVSITEPPNESALADTKHENQQKLAAHSATSSGNLGAVEMKRPKRTGSGRNGKMRSTRTDQDAS